MDTAIKHPVPNRVIRDL